MKRSGIVALLALLACMMLAGFAAANGRNETDMVEAYGGLSRTLADYKPPSSRIDYGSRRDPISGDKYTGGFVNAADPNKSSKEKQDYLAATAALGIPFFAMMVVFIAFYLIFALVRFVCCCCGRGCCPRPRDEGYSKKHRLIVRLVITAFTVATFVGAILLWVSAAEIPKSLGTGSSGFVGVTVDSLKDMIDISARLADNIGAAADVVSAQVGTLADLVSGASGGAVTVPSASIRTLADAAKSATVDFKATTQSSKESLEGSVKDVDEYMDAVELYLTIASAVMGAFSVIFLAFAWFGWKLLMSIAFILSPIFVIISMLLAGIGIIFSTFLSDICFELDYMVDVFKSDGAAKAKLAPIAAGMLPCLDDQAVKDVIKPVLQLGNVCVFLGQFSQVGDGITAINSAVASKAPGNFKLTDLPSSGISKPGPGFRYKSDCSPNLTSSSATFNVQCTEPTGKTDNATYKAEVGLEGAATPARALETYLNNNPKFDKQGTDYLFTAKKWVDLFGDKGVPVIVSPAKANEVTASLAATTWNYTKDGKRSYQDLASGFFKIVGDVERSVGEYNEAIGATGGLEWLGRCGHIELLGRRVANDVCSDMDQAFMLFYQGFAVMGIGYVLCSISYLFGIQRLGKDAMSEEEKEFAM